MKVIISDRNVGFYSSLLGIIYSAYTNIENDKVPYILWKNPKYLAREEDNIFDYFFEQTQVHDLNLENSNIINENGIRSNRILQKAQQNNRTFREEMCHMFNTVCVIKQEYKDILEQICDDLEINNKIGIHLRRTDRFLGGRGLIYAGPKTDTIIFHLKKKKINNFYIATDCEDTFKVMSNNFECKSYATIRSSNTKGIHHSNTINPNNKEIAKECFLEGLVLSRCNFLFRMTSNFTIFALIVNPDIPFEDLSETYEEEIKKDFNLEELFIEDFLSS